MQNAQWYSPGVWLFYLLLSSCADGEAHVDRFCLSKVKERVGDSSQGECGEATQVSICSVPCGTKVEHRLSQALREIWGVTSFLPLKVGTR